MQTFFDILAFAIYIAGIIGIIRWKKLEPTYYPFVVLTWLACLNETASYFLVVNGYTTVVNNNVYMLLESLLITWFFEQQGLFKSRPMIPIVAASLFVCFWMAESFVWTSHFGYTIWFQIFYAFFVVLISVGTINRLLIAGRQNILADALFLICTAYIMYFTVTVLVYAFLIYGLGKSASFAQSIFFIKLCINFLSNIIFAYATLRIPERQMFNQAKPYDAAA